VGPAFDFHFFCWGASELVSTLKFGGGGEEGPPWLCQRLAILPLPTVGGVRLVHFSVVSVIVLLDVFAHVPHLAQMRTTLNIEIGVGVGWGLTPEQPFTATLQEAKCCLIYSVNSKSVRLPYCALIAGMQSLCEYLPEV